MARLRGRMDRLQSTATGCRADLAVALMPAPGAKIAGFGGELIERTRDLNCEPLDQEPPRLGYNRVDDPLLQQARADDPLCLRHLGGPGDGAVDDDGGAFGRDRREPAVLGG